MIFFKRNYVNTTEEIDAISIIHELRYAIRDSGAPEGFLTAIVPSSGAGLIITTPIDEVIDEIKASLDVFGSEAGTAMDKLRRERDVGSIVQSSILGRTIHIPFQDAKLLIDPYDEVFLFDFEKKKDRREFIIQIISEAAASDAQDGQQEGGQALGRMQGEEG